jgi:hypothetical protein
VRCARKSRERPRIGQETGASHVRVWVTQEVDLLGRTQPNKSPLGAAVPSGPMVVLRS